MFKPSEMSLAGWMLLEQADTIRERVFCRVLRSVGRHSISFLFQDEVAANSYLLSVTDPSLPGLILACSFHPGAAGGLANIPISRPYPGGDEEVCPWLQDLADIVAWEATEAFRAGYYPGVEVSPAVDEGHVWLLMEAMQREMDREAARTQAMPLVLRDLPQERQWALAERRRWWFGKFGITPQTWETRRFALFDVADEPMPEALDIKWREGYR